MVLKLLSRPIRAASTAAGQAHSLIGATGDLVDRVEGVHERTSESSHVSVMSYRSAYSVTSWFSAGSALSVGSAGSFGSVASAASIFSLGSAGSVLSIGSAGSIFSIGSTGSVCAIGGRGQMGPKARAAVRGAGSAVAVAALVAAALRPS